MYMVPNVKTRLNLSIKAKNLKKTVYISSHGFPKCTAQAAVEIIFTPTGILYQNIKSRDQEAWWEKMFVLVLQTNQVENDMLFVLTIRL